MLLSTKFGIRTPKTYLGSTPLVTSEFKRGFICGIEVEVENVKGMFPESILWNVKSDGSLRNNGVEFISVPLESNGITEAVNTFWDKQLQPHWTFSQRTSVHVHVNVADLTFEQLGSLLFLYCAMEKALFDFVGNDRASSIFCVPLTDTMYPTTLVGLIIKNQTGGVTSWEKYSALNLSRLREIGTVEFRHMPGTRDKEKMYLWLKILQALRMYVVNHSFDQVTQLLHVSDEISLVNEVFPDEDIRVIFRSKDIQKLFKRGLQLVKVGLASNQVTEQLLQNLSKDSEYNFYMEKR